MNAAAAPRRSSRLTHHLFRCLASALATLAVPTLALADPPSICSTTYEPSIAYPSLFDGLSPVLEPRTTLVVYVDDTRSVVEIDGCFYTLDALAGEVLTVELEPQTELRLVFVLVGETSGATISVADDSVANEEAFSVEGELFAYRVPAGAMLEFGFTSHGPQAPTVPIIVQTPIRDDPPPS